MVVQFADKNTHVSLTRFGITLLKPLFIDDYEEFIIQYIFAMTTINALHSILEKLVMT